MLHLPAVSQMVTSNVRKATLRSKVLLARRLAQLTVVAYVKLLRIVMVERLWAIPPRVRAVTGAVGSTRPEKEISP